MLGHLIMEKRKKYFREPNVQGDHCSHKSGPNFFTESVARNSLKSQDFGPKMLYSVVGTPTAKSYLFHAYVPGTPKPQKCILKSKKCHYGPPKTWPQKSIKMSKKYGRVPWVPPNPRSANTRFWGHPGLVFFLQSNMGACVRKMQTFLTIKFAFSKFY